jgi:hypothetical protein
MSVVILLVLGFLVAQVQVPVQIETATFTVSIDGSPVGTEEFSLLRNGPGFLAQARTELRVGGESIDARSAMRLDSNLALLSYEFLSGGQRIELTVAAPTTEVSVTVDGRETTLSIRLPANGVIVDSNFFHHYVMLLYRLGRTGGSLPAFVPQQMTLGSLTVMPTGDNTYELTTENVRMEATTDAEGRLVRLEVPEAGVVVER